MKRYTIQLTDDERAALEEMVDRGRVEAGRARRARMLLHADSGSTDEEIHFTPKHGSWLNMAETELSILSRQCLDRRIANIAELTTEVAAWNVRHNADPAPIRWRFTNAEARIRLCRLYPSRGACSSVHRALGERLARGADHVEAALPPPIAQPRRATSCSQFARC